MDTLPDGPADGSWVILLDKGTNVLNLEGPTDARAGDLSWVNYTLEIRVKLMVTNPGHINIRYKDVNERYSLRFTATEDLRLIKMIKHLNLDVEKVDFRMNSGTWYTFKIVCIGNRILVYINDFLKIDYLDKESPILNGGIGLETGVGSDIYFDDVMIFSTYEVSVNLLLERVENEINQARLDGYETTDAEKKLEEAYDAFEEGKLSLTESLANEALETTSLTKKNGVSDTPASPGTTPINLTWSIQTITGLITIGATVVGVGGWMYRKRVNARKGRILINKFMEEVDGIYSRFKMNSIKCESELIRLQGEILHEFKEGIIDEENFNLLDKRIEFYLREIREEIKRESV
jgi:hypothetical protein